MMDRAVAVASPQEKPARKGYTRRAFAALSLMTLMSACSGQWAVSYDAPIDAAVSRSWNVTDVRVVVPASLTTTEANTFTPNADVVWHGDPPGNRKAQVQAIMTEAARRAVKPLRGGKRAVLNVTLAEFHAVTPKAVSSAPAAVHNIAFVAQMFDSAGNALTPATQIRADLPAYVGSQAYYAAANGPTQKTRITQHVDAVIKGWLGIGPDIRGTFSSVGR